MSKRTEDQKLAKAPVKLKFGEVEYEVKLLPMLKSMQWREQLAEKIGQALQGTFKTVPVGEAQEALKGGMLGVLLQFPQAMADMVFAYGPDLPKDKILEECSDEQMAVAFGEVLQVAYPFFTQLELVKQVLRG